jgi:hypothetical protein
MDKRIDLEQSYADGSRDACVSGGIDESGKLRYYQVTEEKVITKRRFKSYEEKILDDRYVYGLCVFYGQHRSGAACGGGGRCEKDTEA